MPRIDRWGWGVLALVLSYFGQAGMGLAWDPLASWQADETFRRWSGAAVAVSLGAQVWLAVARWKATAARGRALLRLHRTLGVASLFLLFMHARAPGAGLLFVLGVLMPLQVGLGAARPAGTDAAAQLHRQRWRPLHAAVGMFLVLAALVHVFLVFGYS